MDFRRIPLQFTSNDLATRQAELQKRFGLPANKGEDKMYIDVAKPGLMGTDKQPVSATSSPRQHRVPIFVQGLSEPVKPVDSQNSPIIGKKPRVRVIPIQVEGKDNSTKQQNISGPTNYVKDSLHQNGSWLPEEFAPYVNCPGSELKPKLHTVPHEHNPSKVDCVGQSKKLKTVPVQKEKRAEPQKVTGPKHNGCNVSKVDSSSIASKKQLTGPTLSLKKIEGVLEKLRTYCTGVEKFTGTVNDKQYRYLDEMLTRLMLELDDIDTLGNEEVRLSRKAAIKQVQASLDLLEVKVTRETSEQVIKEELVAEDSVNDQNIKVEESKHIQMESDSTQGTTIMHGNNSMTVPNSKPVDVDPMNDQDVETKDVEVESAQVKTRIISSESPVMPTNSVHVTIDESTNDGITENITMESVQNKTRIDDSDDTETSANTCKMQMESASEIVCQQKAMLDIRTEDFAHGGQEVHSRIVDESNVVTVGDQSQIMDVDEIIENSNCIECEPVKTDCIIAELKDGIEANNLFETPKEQTLTELKMEAEVFKSLPDVNAHTDEPKSSVVTDVGTLVDVPNLTLNAFETNQHSNDTVSEPQSLS